MSKASKTRWTQQQNLVPAVDVDRRRDAFRALIEEKLVEAATRGVDANITLIEPIGPIEADVLLSYSRGNRNERKGAIDAYARDMVAGRWKRENSNPLSLDVTGRFTNGHHRLHAVLLSGVTIVFLISFGNPPDAIDVQDAPITRTLADRFSIQRGLTNINKRLAALRMCMALEESEGANISAKLTLRRTMAEMELGFARHDTALNAFVMSSQYAAAYWGALVFAHPVAPTEVERFAADIAAPEGLSGPAFTLREYLTNARGAGGSWQIEVAKRTLYALRAYLEHRPLSKFAPKSRSDDGSDLTAVYDWFRARRVRGGK